MKPRLATALAALICLTWSTAAFSHCEIPCGIYDDEMRVRMIAEHVTTIEKSMKSIEILMKQNCLSDRKDKLRKRK